jgi:DNA-binding transcriptional regulator YhcF (GntR family)
MDDEEKRLRLEAIEMALEDIENIISTMEEKNYPKDQINEYYKKRWDLWGEQYKTRKS